MDDEIRLVGHRVDLVDRRLQSSGDIRVGRLVEADVAVADLHECEVRAFARTSISGLRECPRDRNATAHRPDQACTCPCHALQKSTTIDAVIVEVLQFLIDKILHLVCHVVSGFVTLRVDNWPASLLFPVAIEWRLENSAADFCGLRCGSPPCSPKGPNRMSKLVDVSQARAIWLIFR